MNDLIYLLCAVNFGLLIFAGFFIKQLFDVVNYRLNNHRDSIDLLAKILSIKNDKNE